MMILLFQRISFIS